MPRAIFNIGVGAPFLPTFVDAFLNGRILAGVDRSASPLALARTVIYVPTQRAGRALAAQFAQSLGAPAALLPRILPLGGLDDQETASLLDAGGLDAALAPAIDDIERRLILARLAQRWADALQHAVIAIDEDGAPVLDEREPMLVSASPANAYALGEELASLIDEMIIEGVDPALLRNLADDGFDRYWAITTEFLKIALEQWPAILKERGLTDRAARGKALIDAQTARLRDGGAMPVVAIGSTGANPATARLLAAIAAAPNGAVVLPGVDLDLDEASWNGIGHGEDTRDEPSHTHPQAVLSHLLSIMDACRDDIVDLSPKAPRAETRRNMLSQAMRPADTTENWRAFRADADALLALALQDVTIIEAPDERREALALALAMREALETPGRTAALVTPDRDVARRVAAELGRFAIDIDDSGGRPLATTHVGSLARIAAQIADEGAGAVAVASLLAHPLTRFGAQRSEIAEVAQAIEIAVLRVAGRRDEGWAATCDAAQEAARDPKTPHPAVRRIDETQWCAMRAVLAQIDAAAALLTQGASASLAQRAKAHRAFIEDATRADDEIADDEGVEELLALFDRLIAAGADFPFDASSYVALVDRLLYETMVRGPRRAHPRLKILGPLEARLLDADLVLLAGLDESVWPPQVDTGAFLNRSMRRQLGLTPPERRIGQSAHDFVMAFGASSVVVSRAAKRNGSPTVASRFLTRLRALAGPALEPALTRGAGYVRMAEALDTPNETREIARPEPRPPVHLRPTQLSVTRIETLRRDPYSIYAERILQLAPLQPLGVEIGAREMGTAIHEALAAFTRLYPRGELPADARIQLMQLARQQLAPFLDDPSFRAFAWPRIEAGLDHALDFEAERRTLGVRIFIEERGEWRFDLPDGSPFCLTAYADRIEIDPAGDAAVFDYKTGVPPTRPVVAAGFAPQLTLEAAMITAGAFPTIGKHACNCAAYVRLGGADGGATLWLEWKDKSFADVVAEHKQQLVIALAQFRDEATAYVPRPYVAFASQYGDYDHLARVKEWSRGGGEAA